MRPLGAPPGCTATARSILHALQQSRPRVLPSSHSSPLTRVTTPVPHGSFDVQSAEQPSPAVVLLSSQTSPRAVSMMPSPQRAGLQFGRHVAFGALELPEPASHCSPVFASTMLLPQVSFDLQSAEQPSPARLLPSSQNSLCEASTMRSPHRCS